MAAAYIRLLLAGSAALLALAAWQRDALPPPVILDPSVREDPVQEETAAPPFRTTVGGMEHTVRPVFAYDLSGVVVSKHDADTWWDSIHKAWRDELKILREANRGWRLAFRLAAVVLVASLVAWIALPFRRRA